MGISRSTVIIKNDGTLWATGDNSSGQLGLGDKIETSIFKQAVADDIANVAVGVNQTMILKNDSTLWVAGSNSSGQLGLGNLTDVSTFHKVDISDIVNISCGNSYSFVLKKDGTLWSTGINSTYQLGLGDKTNRDTFTKVEINGVKSISCGFAHALVLKKDGSLWGVGNNDSGQLGLGHGNVVQTFTRIDIDNIKAFVVGVNYSAVLKKDGTVWMTGYNGFGQFGIGDKTNRNVFTKVFDDAQSISCGQYHSFILKSDGTLWAAGYNYYGQLGLGGNTDSINFSKANIGDIKEIFCGLTHTAIVKNNGTLFATGQNTYGQLGLGNRIDTNYFTEVNISDVATVANHSTPIDEAQMYLIKTPQANYTIDQDTNTLSEITGPITAQLIQNRGIDLETINENIDVLPDEFSLVSDNEFNVVIDGLKEKSQLIVASNDFSTAIKEHIDYFKSEATTSATSTVKMVFSIDGGLTWKTYQDGAIADTAIKIPCKVFETLSEIELQEWDAAKAEVLLNGIDASILETIDFNTIEFDKIRFAYVMNVEAIDDTVGISKLLWQFDAKGYMQQLKDTEFDLKLHSSSAELRSLIDSDMFKVNILPNWSQVI